MKVKSFGLYHYSMIEHFYEDLDAWMAENTQHRRKSPAGAYMPKITKIKVFQEEIEEIVGETPLEGVGYLFLVFYT